MSSASRSTDEIYVTSKRTSSVPQIEPILTKKKRVGGGVSLSLRVCRILHQTGGPLILIRHAPSQRDGEGHQLAAMLLLWMRQTGAVAVSGKANRIEIANVGKTVYSDLMCVKSYFWALQLQETDLCSSDKYIEGFRPSK